MRKAGRELREPNPSDLLSGRAGIRLAKRITPRRGPHRPYQFHL